MMKRRRMLGLAAACALAFTGSFAGYADPVTYDQTADASYGGQTFNFDAGTPTVYPGDTVYGPVTIYLGADNAAGGKAEQLETDDSGTPYFKDKTAAVYKVTDVTPESSGETEMVPVTDEAGNPVLNEDGSSAMQAVAAADPDPAYQFDLAGYVVEAVYGTLSGETGDVDSVSSLQMTAADGSQSEVTPDAKYYAEGTDVTLTADPAPEGLSFAGWTVTEITDDGTVSQAGDVASLNLAGLTAETITYPGLTFTMGKPEHVLIFTAQYAQTVTDTEAPAEAQAETPDAADALAADALTGVDTSGIDLTKASITFAMPAANVEATANYETISYSITAAPGSGASDPYTEVTLTTQDGTSLYSGKSPVSGVSAAAGTVVTAALKNTSAKMKLTWKDGTSDGITDNGNGSFTFTLNGDASLIYTASETYQVTVSVSGGVITNDGNKTGGSYLSGTELTVQANVPANNIFEGWTVSDPALASVSDAGAESTTLTIAGELTASGSVTLTANFKPVTYNLTVVSGSGNGQYASATPASISADAPKAGYKFSGWTLVSGSGTFADQKAASTTFTCGSDAKVQANYEPIPYKITVKNGKPSGTYTVGQDIDLVPDFPAAGKEFDKWSVTSGKLSIDYKDSYYATATVQASDATVTALYKNGPSPDNNAITGLQNDMEYLKSSTLTFNAVGAGMDNDNPNPGDYRYRPTGYQIGSVTGNWSQAPYQTSMAINAVGDYTLTVTFAREVYDGSTWNADGSTDSKSITFHVVNTLSVETGDTSPVMTFIVLGLAALAVAVAIGTAFVVRDRKRRRG